MILYRYQFCIQKFHLVSDRGNCIELHLIATFFKDQPTSESKPVARAEPVFHATHFGDLQLGRCEKLGQVFSGRQRSIFLQVLILEARVRDFNGFRMAVFGDLKHGQVLNLQIVELQCDRAFSIN